MPSANADTSTLLVKIQNSSTDTTTNTYSLAGGYNSVDANSKVYFIQEAQDGKYEVYFGDGINGKSLADGNIVILEYIVTNKDVSNSASSFLLSGNIGGFSDVTITTISNSQGVEQRNRWSIKHNALYNMQSQDEAVTTSDYETLVQTIFPNALSVSVWGGEDDETHKIWYCKNCN